MKEVWQYVYPIRHNTNIDRQTDGRTDGQSVIPVLRVIYELPEEAIVQVHGEHILFLNTLLMLNEKMRFTRDRTNSNA